MSVTRRAAAIGCASIVLLLVVAVPRPASADVVTDWNAVLDLVTPRFGGPQQQARVRAMVQIAVHDALNAIDPRYERYISRRSARWSALP